MNKKGMTTIELITSFALASVIFVILFNITLALRDIYVSSGLKTDLLIEQANLSKSMNSVINSNTSINKISINNATSTNQYTEYNLETSTGNYSLIIDEESGKISFDKYTYYLTKNTSIKRDNNELYNSLTSRDIGNYVHITDNLLIIDIPIYSNLFKENFGVKVVYLLNGLSVDIEQ